METLNGINEPIAKDWIRQESEIIANEINGAVMALMMREIYYNGCYKTGMYSEWRKYCKFRKWEKRTERYFERLFEHNEEKYRRYHTEFSWKPSKWLLNIRLLVWKVMDKHTKRLENKLVKFNPEDYYKMPEA